MAVGRCSERGGEKPFVATRTVARDGTRRIYPRRDSGNSSAVGKGYWTLAPGSCCGTCAGIRCGCCGPKGATMLGRSTGKPAPA